MKKCHDKHYLLMDKVWNANMVNIATYNYKGIHTLDNLAHNIAIKR